MNLYYAGIDLEITESNLKTIHQMQVLMFMHQDYPDMIINEQTCIIFSSLDLEEFGSNSNSNRSFTINTSEFEICKNPILKRCEYALKFFKELIIVYYFPHISCNVSEIELLHKKLQKKLEDHSQRKGFACNIKRLFINNQKELEKELVNLISNTLMDGVLYSSIEFTVYVNSLNTLLDNKFLEIHPFIAFILYFKINHGSLNLKECPPPIKSLNCTFIIGNQELVDESWKQLAALLDLKKFND